jgi:hypothetical protein
VRSQSCPLKYYAVWGNEISVHKAQSNSVRRTLRDSDSIRLNVERCLKSKILINRVKMVQLDVQRRCEVKHLPYHLFI